MKFIHTGDLHIGKVLHEYDLLADQKYILDQIAAAAVEEKADAVLIAGDVYDRAIPGADAIRVLDDFLNGLIAAGIQVMMISGNHDSPGRLSFGSRILETSGLHIAGLYNGELKKVTLTDSWGRAAFFLLPFIKPGEVGKNSYQEAVKEVLDTAEINSEERNVLITHYFVTNSGQAPLRSDSETEIQVGGLDQIDAGTFDGFDYTALGHIHRPQQVGDKSVYYAGAPLKYSFSEAYYNKSVYVVELKEKGEVEVKTRTLKPLHDVRIIKGKLKDLLDEQIAALGDKEDYICACLTDEAELFEPMAQLKSVYPNAMQIILEKLNRKSEDEKKTAQLSEEKEPVTLIEEFFTLVAGREPGPEQMDYIRSLLEQAEEEQI